MQWELWGRFALAGVATRREVEESWSLGDVFAVHLLLDYHDEAQRAVLES